MCGIAGLFNYTDSINHSNELSIKKMLSSIQHRGPDETGIYLNDHIALGSVRLSIIDLATGQQPLSDVSENYWIVYNGEVFNYAELRSEILLKGIHLKTHSDTEVVVQMYALYGPNCLKYFNGQFSFAIWDKRKKELFIARDRVGIRPLFYYSYKQTFAFCSEIKGLFTLENIVKEIDPESLAQIFTFWTTISPNTPFKGVYELPPGHYMIINESGVSIHKFWQLTFSNQSTVSNTDFNESANDLTDLLKDAVKIRLRSDVPVGAYLSGGLDSSVTTAFIHDINPDILHTFSIGFKDKIFDETQYQVEASKYFNTHHTAFECTANEIANEFMKTIWHTEFPILRTSPTPMFLLSKKVKDSNIKVVITGEGADEFLAGYNIFKEAKIRKFWSKFPNSTIRPKLLSSLYPYLPMMKDASTTGLKMFFGYQLTNTSNPFYSHLLRWHNTARIKSFFSDEISLKLNDYDPILDLYKSIPDDFMDWSDLSRAQYLESTIFMSGYLLSSQGDRVAMGNSVEGRYPFLDYRVIEFCNQLPDSYKLNCLNEKFILKKISKGKIPDAITNRQKQPYRAPIASSFFNSQAPAYISDILSDQTIASFGIFNPIKVRALINKIKSQAIIPEVDQMAIAAILSTQLLYKMFIIDPISVNIDTLKNLIIIRDVSFEVNVVN